MLKIFIYHHKLRSTHLKSLHDEFSIIHRLAQFVSFYSCFFTTRYFFFTAFLYSFVRIYFFLFGENSRNLSALLFLSSFGTSKNFFELFYFPSLYSVVIIIFSSGAKNEKLFHSSLTVYTFFIPLLLYIQEFFLSQIFIKLALSPFWKLVFASEIFSAAFVTFSFDFQQFFFSLHLLRDF